VSIKVREWLRKLGIDTTHEEREEIDREIERRTKQYCHDGIELLNQAGFLAIVDSIRRRPKKPIAEPVVA
jgi:restriction endonuclease S subunit